MIRSLLPILLGISTSLVIILPYIKVYDLPLAYVMCITIFALSYFFLKIRGNFVSKSSFILTFPVLYIAIIGLALETGNVLQILSRNGVSFICALGMIYFIRDRDLLMRFMAGFSILVIINVMVAFGQFFDIFDLRLVTLTLIKLSGADYVPDEAEILFSSFRIPGLQIAAHIFAYNAAIISLMFFVTSILTPKKNKYLFIYFLIISIACATVVLLSAQRTSFWPMILALVGALIFRFQAKDMRYSMFIVIALALVGFSAFSAVQSDFSVTGRLLSSAGEQSSDSIREATWEAAIKVIEEDPWFGRAYDRYQGVNGIHNGFLNGWAMFGLPWLILFTGGLGYYMYRIRRHLRGEEKFLFYSFVLIIFANMGFHTMVPSLNDVIYFPALAYASMFQRWSQSDSASINYS